MTTLEAKKRTSATRRARMRRGSVRPDADVRRGPDGAIEMIEFTEYVRDTHAPQILVNRVGGIYLIDKTIVKCTFVLDSPGVGGARQTVERASLLWQPRDVMEASDQFAWAWKEWQNGTFQRAVPDDGGGRRPRTQ